VLIRQKEAKELCHKVNMIGVENLARISAIRKIPLIHISTDYVFDGTNNILYKEDDITNPQSVYGKSKLEAEKAFMDLAYSGVIIRTSWLYSSFGNNSVKTIIRLGNDRNNLNVIFEQIGTPTYAYDLAEAIFKILPQIKDGEKDIYHFSNEGVASWYDLAWDIVEMKNINCRVIPIKTKDYLLPAARPQYSVLNKEKIKERFNINHWKEGLKKCLKKIY
jgi:dTDP-4-dehydrorhamnose reductase